LWQVLAGTVDKEPGASRVVDPQKVLPFLARISNYHVRKAVSVYIPDIQSVALAHSQEAIANVAEGAVSIAQVIFVGLVIFGHEDDVDIPVSIEINRTHVLRVMLGRLKHPFLPR